VCPQQENDTESDSDPDPEIRAHRGRGRYRYRFRKDDGGTRMAREELSCECTKSQARHQKWHSVRIAGIRQRDNCA